MNRRHFTSALVAIAASAVFSANAFAADLKVGATPVPHADILNLVKGDLAKQGINLKIVEFTDYVQPNLALADKSIDANFFQHIPYLESFSKDRRLDLVNAAGIHIEPIGVYSRKVKDLKSLSKGATIAIPNDPTNGGRALALLAKNGVIELKANAGLSATALDIVKNPSKLKFKEVEAALLPRVLADVDAAVINSNYAIDAKLNPVKDAIAIESSDSPYVNIIAVRRGDEKRADIQALIKAIKTPAVKEFILKKYSGAVVSAF